MVAGAMNFQLVYAKLPITENAANRSIAQTGMDKQMELNAVAKACAILECATASLAMALHQTATAQVTFVLILFALQTVENMASAKKANACVKQGGKVTHAGSLNARTIVTVTASASFRRQTSLADVFAMMAFKVPTAFLWHSSM